ncbi:hypothetical protein ABK040_001825 [Willaertia magna]
MEQLSEDLLLNIFTNFMTIHDYLNVMLVCKYWNNVTNTSLFWLISLQRKIINELNSENLFYNYLIKLLDSNIKYKTIKINQLLIESKKITKEYEYFLQLLSNFKNNEIIYKQKTKEWSRYMNKRNFIKRFLITYFRNYTTFNFEQNVFDFWEKNIFNLMINESLNFTFKDIGNFKIVKNVTLFTIFIKQITSYNSVIIKSLDINKIMSCLQFFIEKFKLKIIINNLSLLFKLYKPTLFYELNNSILEYKPTYLFEMITKEIKENNYKIPKLFTCLKNLKIMKDFGTNYLFFQLFIKYKLNFTTFLKSEQYNYFTNLFFDQIIYLNEEEKEIYITKFCNQFPLEFINNSLFICNIFSQNNISLKLTKYIINKIDKKLLNTKYPGCSSPLLEIINNKYLSFDSLIIELLIENGAVINDSTIGQFIDEDSSINYFYITNGYSGKDYIRILKKLINIGGKINGTNEFFENIKEGRCVKTSIKDLQEIIIFFINELDLKVDYEVMYEMLKDIYTFNELQQLQNDIDFELFLNY